MSNVLSIWAGATEGEEARAILRRIMERANLLPRTPGDYRLKPDFEPQTGGTVQIGTPALGTILGLTLFELGMDRQALSYLKNEWTRISDNGTFAEHFEYDSNTSLCHGWSAAPVLLLPRYVLGVKPVSPGWTKVKVSPHPGSLKWAEGSIITPLGELKIAWQKDGKKLDVHVDAPDGMTVV